MTGAPALRRNPTPLRGSRPWTQQWFGTGHLAPVWMGLAFALAIWCIHAVGRALVGALGEAFWSEGAGPAAVLAVIAGYALAAMAYSVRGQVRALHRLRPYLRVDDVGFRELLTSVQSFDMRTLRIVGLVASAGSAAVFLLYPEVGRGSASGVQELALLPVLFVNVVPSWMVARTLSHELRAARLFSRIGRRQVDVDLWDRRPLAPFVHRGLQSALLWSAGMAVASLMFLVGDWAGPVLASSVLLVLVAVAALVLPVYGVHRSIAETKQARLDRLHVEIRACETALLGDGDVADAAARLPGLLALRESVRGLWEWPFDVPSLVRFGLYVAIGLGSWLGGAIVERMLGAVLE